MVTNKVNCVACGAPIQLLEDVEFINCSSCGSFLQIQRGDGFAYLKIVKEISQTIEASGKATTSAIQKGTQVTQEELRRLQITQELNMVEMQLNTVRAEIRTLTRQTSTSAIQKQLTDLRWQEYQNLDRFKNLRRSLAGLDPVPLSKNVTFMEMYLSIISTQIDVLKPFTYNYDIKKIISGLEIEKQLWNTTLFNEKINLLRINMESFNVDESSIISQSSIESYIDLLKKDIARIETEKTTESMALEQELSNKLKSFENNWIELEIKRISENISYEFPSHQELDMKGIDQLLRLVDSDLTWLKSQKPNGIITNNVEKLLKHQKALLRCKRALEKKIDQRLKNTAKQDEISGEVVDTIYFSPDVHISFSKILLAIIGFTAVSVICLLIVSPMLKTGSLSESLTMETAIVLARTEAANETINNKTEAVSADLLVPSSAFLVTATDIPVYTGRLDTQKVSNGYANIRNGPGTGYSVILTLSTQDEFLIKAKSKDEKWLLIDFKNQLGWLYSDLILSNNSYDKLDVAEELILTPISTKDN